MRNPAFRRAVVSSGAGQLAMALAMATAPSLARAGGFVSYAESSDTSTTFSATPIDKTVLNFAVPTAGQYLIISTAEFQNDNTNAIYDIWSVAQTTIDGTVYSQSVQFQPLNGSSSSTNFVGYASHQLVTLSQGAHVAKIQYYTNTTYRRAWIQNARVVAIPVSAAFDHAQTPLEAGVSTTNQNSFDDELTLQFTPLTTETYLVIASAEVTDQSGSVTVRLAQGSQQTDQGTMQYSPPWINFPGPMWRSYITMRQYAFTANQLQTFKLQMHTGSPRNYVQAKAWMKDARITAIPLSAFPVGNKGYGEWESESRTTSTIPQGADWAAVNPTPGFYLGIGSSFIQSQSTSAEVIGNLFMDSTDVGDQYSESVSATDYVSAFHIKRVDWEDTNQHRAWVKWETAGGGTAAVKNARAQLLPVPVDPLCNGQPDGTSCADGNHCNGTEACLSGICMPGVPYPDGASCSDGDVCNGTERCQAGVCLPGSPLACNDGVDCTVDSCDATTGCINQDDACGLGPAYILGIDPAAPNGAILVSAITQSGVQSPVLPPGLPTNVGRNSRAGCVVDMDGDGRPDIVYADGIRRVLAWVEHTGPDLTSFRAARERLIDPSLPGDGVFPAACLDFDGDGDFDVIVSVGGSEKAKLLIYRNEGHGASFARLQFDTGLPDISALAGKVAGNFDGDGRPDLAVFAARTTGSTASRVIIYLNTGDSNQPFTTGSGLVLELSQTNVLVDDSYPPWGALAASDLDGDGRDDIWSLGSSHYLFLSRAVPAFPSGTIFQSPSPVLPLAYPQDQPTLLSYDFSGDGNADLIVASGAAADNNTVRSYLGDGAGGFAGTPTQQLPGLSHFIVGLLPLGAFGFISTQSPPPDVTVNAYYKPDRLGPASSLPPGSYGSPAAGKFSDDRIQSLHVGADVTAVLCRDANFKGACSSFSPGDYNLTGSGVGANQTTSLIVLPGVCPDPGPSEVVLFWDAGFSGSCRTLGPGGYNDSDILGFPPDTVSSLKVGSSVQVTAYGNYQYKTGRTFQIFPPGNYASLGSGLGNDKLRSIKIAPVFSLASSAFTVDTEDADGDGLDDAKEHELAEAFKPYLVFHPRETPGVDYDAILENPAVRRVNEPFMIFQVTPQQTGSLPFPPSVRFASIQYVFIMLRDGGYADGAGIGCSDFHSGDNDSTPFLIQSNDSGRSWFLVSIDIDAIPWPNAGGRLEMSGTHPFVYNSIGKHHLWFKAGYHANSPHSSWTCDDDVTAATTTSGAVIFTAANLYSLFLHDSGGLRPNNVGEIGLHPWPKFLNQLDDIRNDLLISIQFDPNGLCEPYESHDAWSSTPYCNDSPNDNGPPPALGTKWLSQFHYF